MYAVKCNWFVSASHNGENKENLESLGGSWWLRWDYQGSRGFVVAEEGLLATTEGLGGPWWLKWDYGGSKGFVVAEVGLLRV